MSPAFKLGRSETADRARIILCQDHDRQHFHPAETPVLVEEDGCSLSCKRIESIRAIVFRLERRQTDIPKRITLAFLSGSEYKNTAHLARKISLKNITQLARNVIFLIYQNSAALISASERKRKWADHKQPMNRGIGIEDC